MAQRADVRSEPERLPVNGAGTTGTVANGYGRPAVEKLQVLEKPATAEKVASAEKGPATEKQATDKGTQDKVVLLERPTGEAAPEPEVTFATPWRSYKEHVALLAQRI